MTTEAIGLRSKFQAYKRYIAHRMMATFAAAHTDRSKLGSGSKSIKAANVPAVESKRKTQARDEMLRSVGMPLSPPSPQVVCNGSFSDLVAGSEPVIMPLLLHLSIEIASQTC
jgi:hypothetical protein